MSKHTPGPVALVPARRFGLSKIKDESQDDFVLVAARLHDGDSAIALVYRDSEMDTPNAERLRDCWNACEGLADPSVVPEMLTALLLARTVLIDECAAEDQPWLVKALTQVSSAIARAEGRS